ncbi:phosphodiester glycosidase family protein [Roseovarius sp. MMSF_3281]|uniref:phosphodiester glycosidase family protein n=1 Tax=Roseovarius sp. MMSF_3281 TaxID=3046694 RepID=UPI00273DB9FC|nr:phosphodiester glycosidase family protein [Roseovarius sp. MMSF_3281]
MSRAKRLAALALALVGLASPALAVDCGVLEHAGARYTICKVDATRETIRLFLNDPETGKPLGSFDNVAALTERHGETLAFAMNAGMYHQDRSPVGHYLEKGNERRGVITSEGPGNFGLLPNGVFCVSDKSARVYETNSYLAKAPACAYATQSGPMLVIDGALHPRFLKDSDSRYIRNGVGTSADGKTVYFAISESAVNFHDFGTLFRDTLKVPQALYFDGNISRLYVPGQNRHDMGFPMGPIVGVTKPTE